MTDRELIAALKKGDNDAFSIIYKRYWGKVCNFSRLYIRGEKRNVSICGRLEND